jgi:DNA-directed RNA polymerase subunit RPC12/RpoP
MSYLVPDAVREVISLDLLRRALEDAWSHRETLTYGYWCSDCGRSPSERCQDCQNDVKAMKEYEDILARLDEATAAHQAKKRP